MKGVERLEKTEETQTNADTARTHAATPEQPRAQRIHAGTLERPQAQGIHAGMLERPQAQGPHGETPEQRAQRIHVVLVHPEIHWNTGNAGRTCLAVGATLHLVKPLGFSLDEREVRRAGLDYWEYVDLRIWPSWEAIEERLPELGTPFFFSTKAARPFWDAPLGACGDVALIFGSETRGLPGALHERYREQFVTMPILSPRVRSLNLSSSVAIAAYEVLRQRRVTASPDRVRPNVDR